MSKNKSLWYLATSAYINHNHQGWKQIENPSGGDASRHGLKQLIPLNLHVSQVSYVHQCKYQVTENIYLGACLAKYATYVEEMASGPYIPAVSEV